jgi:hypothetical protein
MDLIKEIKTEKEWTDFESWDFWTKRNHGIQIFTIKNSNVPWIEKYYLIVKFNLHYASQKPVIYKISSIEDLVKAQDEFTIVEVLKKADIIQKKIIVRRLGCIIKLVDASYIVKDDEREIAREPARPYEGFY